MKIIELIGLPCSGKSFLIKNSKLKKNNFACHTGSINLCYSIKNIIKLLIVLLVHLPLLIYVILFSPLPDVKSNLKYFLYHLKLFTFLYNLKSSRPVVIDQGIYQSTCSVLINTRLTINSVILKNVLQLYTGSYKYFFNIEIVLLHVEPSTSLTRIRQRNSLTTRFDFWNDEKALLNLERFGQLLGCIFRKYPEHYKKTINTNNFENSDLNSILNYYHEN